ncbi:MAG TPA: hypothetical protein VIK04_01695 [Solirubrobacteraceae bacterium]
MSSPDPAPSSPAHRELHVHGLREGTELRACLERHDPFWGPQLVLAAAVVLQLLLATKLTIKPIWLLPGLEALALVGLIASSPHPRLRHSVLRRRLSLTLTAIVTAANSYSLVMLCHFLLRGGQASGRSLIGSGMVLWITNVLLFGVWFWQLDGGGPLERARRSQSYPDFLFVQMTDGKWAPPDWEPSLLDYLYTSFTNATAFSPTDTMPLTPMAKSLMAIQSLTALVTIGLVVARAVNILS